MEGPQTIECKVCGIERLLINNYPSHIEGKKHISRQKIYDREKKTVYVSGTNRFDETDLKKIFRRFGTVVKVDKFKQKNFSFIQFEDESSVEAAARSRVFAGNFRLFVNKYKGSEQQESKKRKMSDSSEQNIEKDTFGIAELPIKLQDPENCPEELNIFDWQVSQLVSQVELPDESYVKLTELTKDLQEILSTFFPRCQVLIFGSCGSTLAFKGSDVDLFVQIDADHEKFVKQAARVLRKYPSKIDSISTVPRARVPIVKFFHKSSGFQCDLTAKSKLGVCNTKLIRFFILSDERLRPLMMLIKYWGKVCGISVETSNHTTFTCYSLALLVIFYLQQCDPPVLPPVEVLQKLAEQQDFAQGWDCSFSEDLWKVQAEYPMTENKMNVKQLLLGFFEFYHQFDFTNVICPLLGYSVPKADFEVIDELPDSMQLYKEKVACVNAEEKPEYFKINVIVKTQDPFELELNVTRNVSDITFFRFQNALKCSLEIAKSTEEQSLLQALLNIDKNSLDPVGEFHRFNIYMNKKKAEVVGVGNWFELQMFSIKLVLETVLKCKVEQMDGELSNKVQKLETSEDVHTSPKETNPEVLGFSCTGNWDLWTSRAQATKEIKSQCHNLTTDFEKECFVSDNMHKIPKRRIPSFSFQMEISHFHQSNRVQISLIKNKNKEKEDLGWKSHLTNSLRLLILTAESYVVSKCERSDFQNVRDTLRESLKIPVPTTCDVDVSPSVSYTPVENPSESIFHETGTNNDSKEDKILFNQKLLLLSLDKGYNTPRENNTSESNSSMEKLNQSKSSDDPIVNTILKDIVETTSSVQKTVSPVDIQLHPNKTCSKPEPPHEMLMQASENKNVTTTKTPLPRKETNNQSNQDKETKERYENCIGTVREITNTRNIRLDRAARKSSLVTTTKQQNYQNLPLKFSTKHESNNVQQINNSSKPSTYSSFNAGQGYRSQPSTSHEPADHRHSSDRTPIEKQNLWYPTLK